MIAESIPVSDAHAVDIAKIAENEKLSIGECHIYIADDRAHKVVAGLGQLVTSLVTSDNHLSKTEA